MKKKMLPFLLLLSTLVPAQRLHAQEQEIEQLILNIEKLLQFRKILDDMKQGYEVLSQGYEMVKNISEGSFRLHETFLNALLEVSPAVKKYERIVAIIELQGQLTREYRVAAKRFSQSAMFSRDELGYIDRVYSRLFSTSLQQLGDLAVVITAGSLRMSDEERLKSIDVLYNDMQEQLLFLRRFNNSTSVLLLQRVKDNNEIKTLLRELNIK
jgi:hypothetical protein